MCASHFNLMLHNLDIHSTLSQLSAMQSAGAATVQFSKQDQMKPNKIN